MCQKLELLKQIHLFKKGFVIFLKGATFSDFVDTRLSNYVPSGIQIRFPLFWGIFFQLGSNLIKKCTAYSIFSTVFPNSRLNGSIASRKSSRIRHSDRKSTLGEI